MTSTTQRRKIIELLQNSKGVIKDKQRPKPCQDFQLIKKLSPLSIKITQKDSPRRDSANKLYCSIQKLELTLCEETYSPQYSPKRLTGQSQTVASNDCKSRPISAGNKCLLFRRMKCSRRRSCQEVLLVSGQGVGQTSQPSKLSLLVD